MQAAALCALALIIGVGAALAQEPAAPKQPAGSSRRTDAAPSQAAQPEAVSPPANAASSTPAAPEKKTYTVPAGTKVLLQLKYRN